MSKIPSIKKNLYDLISTKIQEAPISALEQFMLVNKFHNYRYKQLFFSGSTCKAYNTRGIESIYRSIDLSSHPELKEEMHFLYSQYEEVMDLVTKLNSVYQLIYPFPHKVEDVFEQTPAWMLDLGFVNWRDQYTNTPYAYAKDNLSFNTIKEILSIEDRLLTEFGKSLL